MPRKGRKAGLRRIEPDPKYGSVKIAKFINKVMLNGKKRLAESIVYTALLFLSKESGKGVVEAFEVALKNVMPLMEVRSRRVGGATYQVPVEVPLDRAMALAMRWIIGLSRKRKGVSMIQALSSELLDAFHGLGASVKKKDDTHKMAESNKAFAHFR